MSRVLRVIMTTLIKFYSAVICYRATFVKKPHSVNRLTDTESCAIKSTPAQSTMTVNRATPAQSTTTKQGDSCPK